MNHSNSFLQQSQIQTTPIFRPKMAQKMWLSVWPKKLKHEQVKKAVFGCRLDSNGHGIHPEGTEAIRASETYSNAFHCRLKCGFREKQGTVSVLFMLEDEGKFLRVATDVEFYTDKLQYENNLYNPHANYKFENWNQYYFPEPRQPRLPCSSFPSRPINQTARAIPHTFNSNTPVFTPSSTSNSTPSTFPRRRESTYPPDTFSSRSAASTITPRRISEDTAEASGTTGIASRTFDARIPLFNSASSSNFQFGMAPRAPTVMNGQHSSATKATPARTFSDTSEASGPCMFALDTKQTGPYISNGSSDSEVVHPSIEADTAGFGSSAAVLQVGSSERDMSHFPKCKRPAQKSSPAAGCLPSPPDSQEDGFQQGDNAPFNVWNPPSAVSTRRERWNNEQIIAMFDRATKMLGRPKHKHATNRGCLCGEIWTGKKDDNPRLDAKMKSLLDQELLYEELFRTSVPEPRSADGKLVSDGRFGAIGDSPTRRDGLSIGCMLPSETQQEVNGSRLDGRTAC